MDKISQVKQLIGEINRLHHHFSKDYFEQGKIEKINLSKTIRHVPVSHIYKYRLTLHESINDYLMTADIDIKYFYRVKTRESIDDKIQRYSAREDQYPVNNWLNDIFGARKNAIETIAVEYGYGSKQELDEAAPKARITKFSELLNLL